MKQISITLAALSSLFLHASADEASVARGKELYDSPGLCTTCHQPNGAGVPGAFPPLAGSEWIDGPVENLVKIVKFGLMGEIEVAGVKYNTVMTPALKLGKPLTDQEIADVLSYVLVTYGTDQKPISVDKVTEILKGAEVTGILQSSALEKPSK